MADGVVPVLLGGGRVCPACAIEPKQRHLDAVGVVIDVEDVSRQMYPTLVVARFPGPT